MNQLEIYQYFQYHNSNIRQLKIGFDYIRNSIKELYKKKDDNGNFIYKKEDTDNKKIELRKIEKSLYRILSGIQVSWAEESFKRLLYENDLFTENQIKYLIETSALEQKWYRALELVFCIAYDLVPDGDETCQTVNINSQKWNLGNELVNQYLELRALITTQLAPNFSIRNKVQHGEWEYAFKPKFSAEFSQEITDKLNNENIITTTSRFNLVNTFYQMIVDMGRFKSNSFALDSMLTPFEYSYQHNIKKIKFEVNKIENSNLDEFIIEMIDREIRGESYRQQNKK